MQNIQESIKEYITSKNQKEIKKKYKTVLEQLISKKKELINTDIIKTSIIDISKKIYKNEILISQNNINIGNQTITKITNEIKQLKSEINEIIDYKPQINDAWKKQIEYTNTLILISSE
jgi:hypothetical protein